jgi:hypothetical protein
MAHQADAPCLALEVAETTADLDAVVVEEPATDRCLVYARWRGDRIEHGKSMTLLRHERQS